MEESETEERNLMRAFGMEESSKPVPLNTVAGKQFYGNERIHSEAPGSTCEMERKRVAKARRTCACSPELNAQLHCYLLRAEREMKMSRKE